MNVFCSVNFLKKSIYIFKWVKISFILCCCESHLSSISHKSLTSNFIESYKKKKKKKTVEYSIYPSTNHQIDKVLYCIDNIIYWRSSHATSCKKEFQISLNKLGIKLSIQVFQKPILMALYWNLTDWHGCLFFVK